MHLYPLRCLVLSISLSVILPLPSSGLSPALPSLNLTISYLTPFFNPCPQALSDDVPLTLPPLHRSNTPAPLSYTKASSVPLPYSHLIRPFLAFSLIIFSFLLFLSLRFFGDLFFSAFLTRPSWASSLTHPYLSSNPSRTQLHLRHARLPVPLGLLDPTRYTVPTGLPRPARRSPPAAHRPANHGGTKMVSSPSIFHCRNYLTTLGPCHEPSTLLQDVWALTICPDLPSCVDVPCSPSAIVWLLQHPCYFCSL